MFKVTVGRAGIKHNGVEMTASMGVNSWAAFAGTDERAYIAGDVAMLAQEAAPVIRALRRRNVEVVAVHNHMLDETPRLFFLHYWGAGRAEDLATAFRAALDQLENPKADEGHK